MALFSQLPAVIFMRFSAHQIHFSYGQITSSLANSMERRPVDVQADRRVDGAVGQLIVRMAEENPDWGYDRIAAALAQFGVSHY